MYYTEYDKLIFNVWNSLESLCFCKTGYDSEDSRLSNAVNADLTVDVSYLKLLT